MKIWAISDLHLSFSCDKPMDIFGERWNNYEIKLKENWNKLKEYIDIKLYNVEYLQKLCGCRIDDEIHMILDIIKSKH